MNTTTATSLPGAGPAREQAQHFRDMHARLREEIGRVMVGQGEIVDGVLAALFAGGHVLLEGVPGLGKTLLVRTLGQALDLAFSRIQFTPDMMPADVQGTMVLVEGEGGGHRLEFQQGPIVANLVLADEINRATPKTQSALLEAMQEKQVTVGRRTIRLPEPFCVMATQNPVEQEGTYPLPEAQLDRFLFKLLVGYPQEREIHQILDRTTGAAEAGVRKIGDAQAILALRAVVRAVPVPAHAQEYAVKLTLATHPGGGHGLRMVDEMVALGASPRGAQALLLGAKVQALLAGRFAVACEDVAAVAPAALRHRLMPNFRAHSEGIVAEQLVRAVLAHVPAPRA
jgi:MoxR-like ATPase